MIPEKCRQIKETVGTSGWDVIATDILEEIRKEAENEFKVRLYQTPDSVVGPVMVKYAAIMKTIERIQEAISDAVKLAP